MLIRPKRKRTSTVESPTSLQGGSNTSTTNSSSLVIKRMKIDVPAGEGVDLLSNNHKKGTILLLGINRIYLRVSQMRTLSGSSSKNPNYSRKSFEQMNFM